MVRLTTAVLLFQSIAICASATRDKSTKRRALRQRNVVRQGKDFVRNHGDMIASSFAQPQENNNQEKAERINANSTAVHREMSACDFVRVSMYPMDMADTAIANINPAISPDYANLTICPVEICADIVYILGTGMVIIGIDLDDGPLGAEETTVPFLGAEESISVQGTGIFASGQHDTCVDVDPSIVEDILANPESYYMKIRTIGFPEGAMIGSLAV
jgi:hypothetical protein